MNVFSLFNCKILSDCRKRWIYSMCHRSWHRSWHRSFIQKIIDLHSLYFPANIRYLLPLLPEAQQESLTTDVSCILGLDVLAVKLGLLDLNLLTISSLSNSGYPSRGSPSCPQWTSHCQPRSSALIQS